MIKCQACGSEHPESSQYCDECGMRLENRTDTQSVQTRVSEAPFYRPANVTSVGIPAVLDNQAEDDSLLKPEQTENKNVHASLVIERGDSVGTEFKLVSEESHIGRWDADNGIFPDVDLDALDTEAKVSRRHARILFNNGNYTIEDLGSTNGTYVNRGRRLIPGNPSRLEDSDEIIVGKTFLRFYINK